MPSAQGGQPPTHPYRRWRQVVYYLTLATSGLICLLLSLVSCGVY